MYYRVHLNVKERKGLIPEKIKAICIEIFKPKSKSIFVTNLYKPLNTRTEVLDAIKKLFENLDAENKETILVGDFNCDLLTDNKSTITSRLVDMMNLFQLTQVIEEQLESLQTHKHYCICS